MTALDAVADLATIATAAVAVWWWFLVRRRSRNTRKALEEKLIEKASKRGANDVDSLTLDQMMAYLNASAAEVGDAVAQSRIVESYEGTDGNNRLRKRRLEIRRRSF